MNYMILLSEEMFMIFDYCIHNRRQMDPKYVLRSYNTLFANVLEIAKFVKLRLIKNSCYTVYSFGSPQLLLS